jgi:site-specific DNA-methyltransferase (cytosine-N4-specific)
MKPYIQPFERSLALAELASLSGAEPQPAAEKNPRNDNYLVNSTMPARQLARRLAYWESVTADRQLLTDQVLREATANVARNGVPFDEIEERVRLKLPQSLPNRRSLRYGPHGLHEYRGKFFPQLVRALINVSRVPRGGVVADPMSGSGTTLVESVLAGCHGIGLDMNPLSVFMGRTKCAVLSADPREIIEAHNVVSARLSAANPSSERLQYFSALPDLDQKYLANWFSPKALGEMDCITRAISEYVRLPAARDLMCLSFSNIIRGASWQKAADLRVRKEVRPDEKIHPISDFLEEFGRAVKTVVSCAYQIRGLKMGTADLQEGDARQLLKAWKRWRGRVDTVITSPPYATALPYLDTDRLSLIYMGFLTRKGQRDRDQLMIGNREINEKLRREYWRLFGEVKHQLPASITALIERIDTLNSDGSAGFRRRNLSALLAKYFLDMKEVLSGIACVLKPGAWAYIVIGDNHTVAGGERVEIATAPLLGDIARMVGLHAGEHIPMDMLVSREIYKKNAVASETILCLQRPH